MPEIQFELNDIDAATLRDFLRDSGLTMDEYAALLVHDLLASQGRA